MTELALAIDFGTSRTKVAWRDRGGSVQLLHFEGEAYLPSIFYLPGAGEEILLGADARDAYEDDPLGVVDGLKRSIEKREGLHIRPDRPVEPQELLVHLLNAIKQQALEEIEDFEGISPEQVWLTVPGNAGIELEIQLKQAARSVGWDMAQTVHEPVAAARYWLYGEGYADGQDAVIVVLDCGGGTTDWACLQRSGTKIHLSEAFRPGDMKVGGIDVDRALSEWVRQQHPELHAKRPEPRIREQLRIWKEAMFNGETPKPLRVTGQPLDLSQALLDQIYRKSFLNKVLKAFEGFLQSVVELHLEVTVLLVGGNVTASLESAVAELHPEVKRCDDPLGAVIRGALAQLPTTGPRVTVETMVPQDNTHSSEQSKAHLIDLYLVEAIAGAKKIVKTNKISFNIKVPPRTKSGTIFRFKNAISTDEGKRDFIFKVRVIDHQYEQVPESNLDIDYQFITKRLAMEGLERFGDFKDLTMSVLYPEFFPDNFPLIYRTFVNKQGLIFGLVSDQSMEVVPSWKRAIFRIKKNYRCAVFFTGFDDGSALLTQSAPWFVPKQATGTLVQEERFGPKADPVDILIKHRGRVAVHKVSSKPIHIETPDDGLKQMGSTMRAAYLGEY